MKNLSIILAAVTVFCVAGCKTTTSPSNSGSFAGRVLLFDSTGAALPDFSGTSVVLDGTTFKTTTDSLGQWTISGVPEGQYNVTASKPGFGTFHWYEQQIIDGKLDLQASGMAIMPDDIPVLTYAGWDSEGVLNAEGRTAGYWQGLQEYFDLDSTTQPSEPHFATGSLSNGGIQIDDLRAAGARPGQKLYVSISTYFSEADYGDAFLAFFFDPMHNEYRWASTGPKSNVIAVTMP